MGKEKDVIRLTNVPLACEECEKDIEPGSLVNEYCDEGDGHHVEGDGEVMFYCMECVPVLVGMGAVWVRGDVE